MCHVPTGHHLLRVLTCIACVSTATLAGAQDPEQPECPATASYRLDATLDTQDHRISAFGTITLVNTSQRPLTELWFHLYPNAFASQRTRFSRSLSTSRRASPVDLFWTGRLEVDELSVAGLDTENLWLRAERTSPGDPDDATDLRVPLSNPVDPGTTLTFKRQIQNQTPISRGKNGMGR